MEASSTLAKIRDAVIRTDAWQNVVLGLGGRKDPSAATTFTPRGAPLSEAQLEALYVEDHFAARIIEALPSATLRAGWDLAVPGDPAQSATARDLYRAREEQLGVPAEMAQGSCWGRVFGGALTWIGADDGQKPDQPLRENAIKTILFLHTFDKRDVQVWRYYSDSNHPKFRQPELYRIFPRVVTAPGGGTVGALGGTVAGGAIVHESRCIRWGGQPTTDQRRQTLSGWDDSVLERCWDALKQIGEDYGAKSLLLGRISQAVYKFKNLWAMISGAEEETLRKRVAMLDASRSRSRAIILDIEEDLVNITQPLAGVPELMDKGTVRLAAAGNMPVTVLMGQPMTGMNTTGQGDLEIWSQTCGSWRETEFRPRHFRIAQLMLLAKDSPLQGAPPAHWSIAYRPLRAQSPVEVATVRKTEAETDAINIDKGIYPAEVAAFRYASSGQTTGIVLEEKELRANLERRRALANAPPKDNAELGTVGARSAAVMEIIADVTSKKVARESGIAVLVELHRFTPEVAAAMLGPEGFVPAAIEQPKPPGPPPAPPAPGGAGRPPQIPGLNDGGAPPPGAPA